MASFSSSLASSYLSLCVPKAPGPSGLLTEPGPRFSGWGLTCLTKDGVLLTLCSDPTGCAQE